MQITKHNAYGHFPKNRVETGVLTTEHSASSYGRPVFVSFDGLAYGPADLESVSLGMDLELFGADVSDFERRIISSVYAIRA